MSVVEQSTVPIKDLVLIPELNPRKSLCEETIIRYMESFQSLPPIRVQARTNVVVDGYHRVEAAIRLGLEEIPAKEEPIEDEELRLVAGLANAQHGQPLTRTERNTLAVALVRNYGKLREEAGQLLGMSASAVTLALREHQFNEQLSEKLGSPVQVINSAHVRALYRVGPDQRERLLEAVVSKVDEDGQPYPLTGAELKLLVDRMLDPATPTAELNRLLSDPRARPKPPASSSSASAVEIPAAEGDPFVPETGFTNTKPWEREWESPLKGGDGEAFDRMRSVDEDIERNGGGGINEERQIADLLRRAENNVAEQQSYWENSVPAGNDDFRAGLATDGQIREGVKAATSALEEIVPQVEQENLRTQLEAVLALLKSLN